VNERSSYDAVADAYAARYLHELDAKPLDRALLRAFADDVRTSRRAAPAPVADVGCGPGQVARFIHDQGVEACGVDISPRMCALARTLHPGISFSEGSMLALPVKSGGWAGITAFYAICHVHADQLDAVFGEFHRAVRPGGPLLIAFHAGDETRHADELLGVSVDLDFYLHPPALIISGLTRAGLSVEATLERRPYEPQEVATQRAYVLARKPST
jgi:SAM-dependent methyltransferase